ncbi:MAG TPA: cation:proton antiporter [Gaiellaceae bacterium]|nr:cation:proton antiporter [Gaiellaceae bacterium]
MSTADAAGEPALSSKNLTGGRLIGGYVVVIGFLAAAIAISIGIGRGRDHAPPIGGFYKSGSPCLGSNFKLAQSGEFVTFSQGATGNLRFQSGHITGSVKCASGGTVQADLVPHGSGTSTTLTGTLGSSPATAKFSAPLPPPGVTKTKVIKRTSEETFGRLMLAIAAVLLAARLVGAGTNKLSQPRVMGEVLAGILLGPTLLGAVWPAAQAYLFPPDIVPLLSAAAQIGLAFYLFLVGMEIDPKVVRQRIGQAAFISNTSVAFPLALGFLIALPVYRLLAPDVRYTPFALFMGVAMSITAFPVLARILIERRMLKRPVGALSMTSAAVDDVTAWTLLALATAIAGSGSPTHALRVILLAALFSAALLLIGSRILERMSRAYDEVGQVTILWLGTIFVCVLLAAYTAQQIGIAAIFGAFMLGLIMPRRAGLTDDVGRTFEKFVVLVLLPLFFVITGLKTHVGALNSTELWLITLLLIAVAIVGKFLGAMLAARWGGFTWRESSAIGALMNTRGLTELIVLNIALDIGVISNTLFTMLVVMALVTTFMAGPILRLIDPKGMFSEPVEEELRRAPRTTEEREVPVLPRTIIVAPQDPTNLEALLTLAEPLAKSIPPREIAMVQVVSPERIVTGTIRDDAELKEISDQLEERQQLLSEHGISSRSVAVSSIVPGQDYVRLASEKEVDLIMLDGRRPLLGGGVPRGSVGHVLEQAPSDVAVLVEKQDMPTLDADHPVMTPFGGGDHDWAALELAAWISSATGAPLKLLGAAGGNGGGDASSVLESASLVVQQLAGVTTESVLVSLQNGGILDATEGAGLLVVGLSDRWRDEGLGPVRSEIAKSAEAPILFVRRGTRPGALAPRSGDVTRFTWSRA